MLRLARIRRSALCEESQKLALSLGQWEKELSGRVSRETLGMLPVAQTDGDYINYLTEREGEASELSGKAQGEAAFVLNTQTSELLHFLRGPEKLQNSALEDQREYLASILENPSHVFLFEGRVPVLLPYQTTDEKKASDELKRAFAAKAAAPAAVAAVPPKKRGCLLPFLLLLLLLLGMLFALWWFLLRPWPMQGSLQDVFDRLGVSSWFKDDYTKQLSDLDEIEKRADALLKKQDEADEAARLLAEKQRQAELDALKSKSDQNADEIEAIKKQLEEAQKAAAAEPPKTTVKPADNDKTKAVKDDQGAVSGKNALPKCTVLKQQGTMPKMVIALDGSRSMLVPDVAGAANRLAAATGAASDLVNSVDKNVDIGFVEINGCPMSKSRGFFTGIQRQALRQTINNVDPMRYDGMTPLVDGLNKIAKMTDGVNADAVGVLISDGEDTCPVTRDMDVCQVAAAIHARKPRLKIHTILIGSNAASAACVARITGGQVFSPQNAAQIRSGLQASGSQMRKVCDGN